MPPIFAYVSSRSSLHMISFRSTGVVDTIVTMGCNKIKEDLLTEMNQRMSNGLLRKEFSSRKNVLQDVRKTLILVEMEPKMQDKQRMLRDEVEKYGTNTCNPRVETKLSRSWFDERKLLFECKMLD